MNHKKTLKFNFVSLALASLLPCAQAHAAAAMVVGYIQDGNWGSVSGSIPWADVSHINDAFGGVNGATASAPSNGAAMVSAAHSHSVKCFISFGGAGVGTWPTSTAQGTSLGTSIANIINSGGYDGADIDWEWPVAGQQAILNAIVSSVRSGIGSGKGLTLYLMPGSNTCGYDFTTMNQYVDWYTVPCYDMNPAGDMWQGALNEPNGSTYTQANGCTPLNIGFLDSYSVIANWYNTNTNMTNTAAAMGNVPYSKMVIGMPFYARNSTGTVSGGQTETDVTAFAGGTGTYDSTRCQANIGGYGVDTDQSFCDKLNWAFGKGYLGVAIWELSQGLPSTSSATMTNIWARLGAAKAGTTTSCLTTTVCGASCAVTPTTTPGCGVLVTDFENSNNSNYLGYADTFATAGGAYNTVSPANNSFSSNLNSGLNGSRYGANWSGTITTVNTIGGSAWGPYLLVGLAAPSATSGYNAQSTSASINAVQFTIKVTTGSSPSTVAFGMESYPGTGTQFNTNVVVTPGNTTTVTIPFTQLQQQPAGSATFNPQNLYQMYWVPMWTGSYNVTVDDVWFVCSSAATPTFTSTKTNTPVPPTSTFTPTLTKTNTPVPPTSTFTFTSTKTNTPVPPTNTSTNTPVPPTNTFTFTKTNSPTNTFSNTPVPPTNTFTFTKTNSPTFSSTNTPVPPTATFTYTLTKTNTPTNSFTNTPVPPTNSFTPTKTYTPTNSFTNTPVPPTSTFTFTKTNTLVNTNTPTVTFTATPTYTGTQPPTSTFTNTPTNTWTGTSTFTNTFTKTFTLTPTNSFTNTPINTSTFTSTNSFTPMNTSTFTFTHTNTPMNTNTPTNSFTFTSTFTPTNSFTGTAPSTSTSTNTPTGTSTFTNSFTKTFTLTPTNTSTNTSAATFTNTSTNSFTPTPTSSFTSTATATATFTATQPLVQVSLGVSLPASQVTGGANNVPVLEWNVSNQSGETVQLTGATLTMAGTGTASTGISSLSVYEIVGGTPILLEKILDPYASSNNALVSIPNLNVPPGSSQIFLVTYDLSSSAPAGTYSADLANAGSLTGQGLTSTKSLNVTGAPVNGAVVMVVAGTATTTFTPTVTSSSTVTSTPTNTWTGTPTMTRTTEPTRTPVLYPNPSTGDPISINVPGSGTADVKVEIFTTAFRKVQDTITHDVTLGTNTSDPQIVMKDKWGNPLASGLYYAVITTYPKSESGGTSQHFTGKFLLLR